MTRAAAQTRPVIRVPVGVTVKTSLVSEDGFAVIATMGKIGTVGEVVVRGRSLWPGWASLDDDPPPDEEIFRCADDIAKVVRSGAKRDGIAVVRHSWVDARMRGTGLGRALYGRVVDLQRAWLDRRVTERAKALGAPVAGARSLADAQRDAAAAVAETEALLKKALRAKSV